MSSRTAPVGQITVTAQELRAGDLVVVDGDLCTIEEVEVIENWKTVSIDYRVVGTGEERFVHWTKGSQVLVWRPMVHIPSGEYIRQAIGHLGSEEV